MKKTIILMTVLALGMSGSVLAKNHMNRGGYTQCATNQQMINGTCVDANGNATQGGFNGPFLSISTVEQAKKMNDDQKVSLRGYIIQALGGKDYLFKDDSGTIEVEISQRQWRGQVITPQDLVEIQGEVDRDWKSLSIDVKRIIKLNVAENTPASQPIN